MYKLNEKIKNLYLFKIIGLVISLIFLAYGSFHMYRITYGPVPGVITASTVFCPDPISAMIALLTGWVILGGVFACHCHTQDLAVKKAWNEEKCPHCGKKIH